MDLLPKTVISIRNEARSAAYRAALGTASGSAFGFLLGSSEPFEAPAIEFSLVSAIPSSDDELWQAPGLFRSQLPAATRVAEQTGVEVIGLFAAWDTCPDDAAISFSACGWTQPRSYSSSMSSTFLPPRTSRCGHHRPSSSAAFHTPHCLTATPAASSASNRATTQDELELCGTNFYT